MRYNAHQIAWGVTRSLRFFSDMLWLMSGPVQINQVLSLFYIVISPLMVYLYIVGQETALVYIDAHLFLPWWSVVVLFCGSGWITATPQPARVYMLATMPLFFYAMVIIGLTASGTFPLRGILPGSYLLLAVVIALLNIRQRFELDILRMTLARTQRDMKTLQARIDNGNYGYTRPD